MSLIDGHLLRNAVVKKKIAKYFALMALLVNILLFIFNYFIIQKLGSQVFAAVSSSQDWQRKTFHESFESKQGRSIQQLKLATPA